MRMRCGGRGKKSWKRISLSLSLSLSRLLAGCASDITGPATPRSSQSLLDCPNPHTPQSVTASIMSKPRHHISWGGLHVQHLDQDYSEVDQARLCDRYTGNTKLHRFAKSDDCLHARKILDGKGKNDIWKLVS